MNTVTVKFKKLKPEAQLPKYSKNGDAGLDLVCTGMNINQLYREYETSLAVQIPRGYVGLLFPRSSVSNYHLTMANCVGVIDSGYRGEVKVRFKEEHVVFPTVYKVGDKVAQLIVMPYPLVLIEEVDELDDSSRGGGGFGSSGL